MLMRKACSIRGNDWLEACKMCKVQAVQVLKRLIQAVMAGRLLPSWQNAIKENKVYSCSVKLKLVEKG